MYAYTRIGGCDNNCILYIINVYVVTVTPNSSIPSHNHCPRLSIITIVYIFESPNIDVYLYIIVWRTCLYITGQCLLNVTSLDVCRLRIKNMNVKNITMLLKCTFDPVNPYPRVCDIKQKKKMHTAAARSYMFANPSAATVTLKKIGRGIKPNAKTGCLPSGSNNNTMAIIILYC